MCRRSSGSYASPVNVFKAPNRVSGRRGEGQTVPFGEVVRFTGLGRRAVVDLIRARVFEEVPGRRGGCEVKASSLEDWLAEDRVDHHMA